MNIDQTYLGRYVVIDILPGGGQADVAKAIDRQTGRDVALKRLLVPSDLDQAEQELARFRRAAQIQIGHPAVNDPIDAGEEDGGYYTVFPFVDGVPLDVFVAKCGGRVEPGQAALILIALAKGVGAAHAQRIVHRDIKPGNILIKSDGSPCLIDFGILRRLDMQTLTRGQSPVGTLLWMSPEQVATPDDVDQRSDLYALGAVFYYMLTGCCPATGDSPVAIAWNICQASPEPLQQHVSSIPPDVETICMRLLAKDRNHRFQTATELVQAFDEGGAAGGYCTACGHRTDQRATYCCHCGNSLRQVTTNAHCLACGTAINGKPACPGCRRRFGSTSHRLRFIAGDLKGVCFRIPEGIYEVGRSALSSRDPHISRRHFQVAVSNGTVQLQDAGSTNKTRVAGQFADAPVFLRPGQNIQIADNIALYTIH